MTWGRKKGQDIEMWVTAKALRLGGPLGHNTHIVVRGGMSSGGGGIPMFEQYQKGNLEFHFLLFLSGILEEIWGGDQ
jgi:hypothetical protein